MPYGVTIWLISCSIREPLCWCGAWRSSCFGQPRVALYCALLFAVHPLASEPVNYISSRSETLAACFYLAAFLGYLRSGRGRGWSILSLLCMGLGLLAKSTVITLPAAILWHRVLFGPRGRRGGSRRDLQRHLGAQGRSAWSRRDVQLHLPYWGLAVGYLLLIESNGFLRSSLAHPVRAGWPQFATQVKALVYYIKLLFMPQSLNVEHQFFVSAGLAEGPVFLALLCLLSLAMVIWWAKGRPQLIFALGWSLS